jgi:hypothetical protein
MKEINHLRDLYIGVYDRITLAWILKESDVRLWTRLNYPRMGPNSYLLRTQ